MNLSDDQIKKMMGSVDTATASDKPIISGLTELGNKALDALAPAKQYVPTDQLYLRLDDLQIPEVKRPDAEAAFKAEGFAVDQCLAVDLMYKTTKRPYTRARRADGACLAVLHVPPEIFTVKSIVMALWPMIGNIDAQIRFIARDLEAPTLIFNNFIMYATQQGKPIVFVPWSWFNDFLQKTGSTEQVFSLPEAPKQPPGAPPPVAAPPVAPLPAAKPAPLVYPPLQPEDRDRLITIWMERGLVNQQFFTQLVSDADWPAPFKNEMTAGFGNNAKGNAQHLLETLANWNRYNDPPERAGDTYLGWVLLRQLNAFGNPPGQDMARIILKYALVSREQDLKAATDRLKGN
jgi:hypothetical protein